MTIWTKLPVAGGSTVEYDQVQSHFITDGHGMIVGAVLAGIRDKSGTRCYIDEHVFLLDKKGLSHILTRHHPKYWDGSTKTKQTFFDADMEIEDIKYAVGVVLQQNRDVIVKRGTNGLYQIEGQYNGKVYKLGVNYGRIGQFYPVEEDEE